MPSQETATTLAELEAEIEAEVGRGWEASVTIGRDLRKIRDGGLFPDATFEMYIGRRWNYARQVGYRFIDAAHIDDALSPIGDKALPMPSEWVARELVPLLRSEHGSATVAEAWGKVSAKHEGAQPPTAKQVRRILVEEGYRTQFGKDASSGPVNIRILLGQFGDKLDPARRRLKWFVERDLKGKSLGKSSGELAVRYADWCDGMSAILRRLAAGETVEAEESQELEQ